VLRVDEVEVGYVVDDAAVGLLGDVGVEAPVAGLHVVEGDLHALGHDAGEAAVGVAEDEDCVRVLLPEHLLALGDDAS